METMTWNREEKVRKAFRELGYLLQCNDFCEERCVFPEIGEGAGCPLNDFEDKVMEAIGRRPE